MLLDLEQMPSIQLELKSTCTSSQMKYVAKVLKPPFGWSWNETIPCRRWCSQESA